MLKYIEATNGLEQIDIILPRLMEVLNDTVDIAKYESFKYVQDIQVWIHNCSEVQTYLENCPEQCKNDSLRGLYEDNQLYVTLSYHPDDPALMKKYNILLAQLFIANSWCRAIENNGNDFKSSRKSAFTFARSICKSENAEVFQYLPENILTTQDYCDVLKTNLQASPRIAQLTVFFNYALGLRPAISRTSQEHEAREAEIHENEVDDGQDKSETLIVKTPSFSPQKEKNIEQSGLTAQEFVNPKEYFEISFSNKNPMQGRTSVEHVLRSKNQSNKISLNNQQFSSRWSVLSEYEASCVIKEIVGMYRKGKDDLSKHPLRSANYLEISALLTIMFWYSVPFEDAIQAVGHKTCPKQPRQKFEFVLGAPSYALIKCAAPSYNSRQRKYTYLDTSSHVALNTGILIEDIIADHYKINVKHSHLFNESVEFYKLLVQKFITNLNKKKGGLRLTPGRISNYMFNHILNTSKSDISYAMLITGRSSILGNTQLYYTSVETRKLNQIFQENCKSIAKNARLELAEKKIITSKEVVFNPPNQMFGGRICPTIDDVTNLRIYLNDQVNKAKQNDPVEIHNAMAIYTSTFVNFATGYRAVGDASFYSDEIDESTGFAVISDKDSADEYHSRLIWIQDECLKQLKSYNSQLKKLLEFFSLRNDKIYRQLNDELYGKKKSLKDSFPRLFLINNNKIVILTPSIFESKLPENYPFPPNAHRHFLRSNLLEMGCPKNVLNAFMGHWERGEEPWESFSSMSPFDFKEVLQPLLTSLIVEKCHWKAIYPYA